MATKGGVTPQTIDDLLTCTICLETFKVPKYLPCLHTFCEMCIKTYIMSCVRKKNEHGFSCPVCRRSVDITENSETPEKWAEQLPGNHFIVSLIDRKSLTEKEKNCSVCEINDEKQPAKFWCTVCGEGYCERCKKWHTTFKLTSKHQLISIEDFHSGEREVPFAKTLYCDEHPDKLIEIYCSDHSKPCCTICATVRHRKCENVISINEAVSGVKESEQARELSRKLKEANEDMGNIIEDRTTAIRKFEDESGKIESKIAELTDQLIKRIKELQQKLSSEIQEKKKQIVLNMNNESTELSSLKSRIAHWDQIFSTCLEQGSELQCLVKLREIQDRMPQYENEFCGLVNEIKDISVGFEPSISVETFDSLGCITQTETFVKVASKSIKFREVNFHSGNVNVILNIDIEGQGWNSGIFVHHDLYLTDNECKKVVHYDDKGTKKRELKIDSNPTDITEVSDPILAVATNSCNVHLIDIKSFSINKVLTLASPALGLCFVNNEYVAVSSGKITRCDGTTGTKIGEHKTGADTLFVVCRNRNDILYMNSRKSVSSVSFTDMTEKTVVYENNQLNCPYGIDVDFEGNIYLTSLHTNTIHQLKSDGSFVRIISVSDLCPNGEYPWVIRFQKNSNRFLLTFEYLGKVLICEIGSTQKGHKNT